MRYWNHNGWTTPTVASASTYKVKTPYHSQLLVVPPRMGPSGSQGGQAEGDVLIAEPKTKPKRPSFYKVILLNDDFTPMDFVVTVLEQIFRKTHEEAIDIMLMVHNKGAAAVGCFTRDVAETKVDQVIEYARINDYPLQCVIEKD